MFYLKSIIQKVNIFQVYRRRIPSLFFSFFAIFFVSEMYVARHYDPTILGILELNIEERQYSVKSKMCIVK